MAQLIDSYSETNIDSSYGYDDTWKGYGQSFTASIGGVLDICKFSLKKVNSPTGNGYAKIYAHTGTYGTSSTPTGSALATSDAFDVSGLTTDLVLTTLTFSGANKVYLNSGYYVVTLEWTNGDATNKLGIGDDNSSPSHGGNGCYTSGSGWGALDAQDMAFYVYFDNATTSTSVTTTSSSTSTSRTTTSSSTSTSRTTTSRTTSTSTTSTSRTTTSTSMTTTSSSTSVTTTSSSTSISTTSSTSVTYTLPMRVEIDFK